MEEKIGFQLNNNPDFNSLKSSHQSPQHNFDSGQAQFKSFIKNKVHRPHISNDFIQKVRTNALKK